MRVFVPKIIVYYVTLSLRHFKENYQLKLDTSLKYVNHFYFKSTLTLNDYDIILNG